MACCLVEPNHYLNRYWPIIPSLRSTDSHMMVILQEIPQPSITKFNWKMIYLKFISSNLPMANELNSNQTSINPCSSMNCRLSLPVFLLICKFWWSIAVLLWLPCSAQNFRINLKTAIDTMDNNDVGSLGCGMNWLLVHEITSFHVMFSFILLIDQLPHDYCKQHIANTVESTMLTHIRYD